MKVIMILTTIILLPTPTFSISAKIHSRLDTAICANLTTDIVVATEGTDIDGRLEILETWKGTLKPGEKLVIPEFALLRTPESRTIECLMPGQFRYCNEDLPKEYVTCTRMVLFLRKNPKLKSENQLATGRLQEWSGVGRLSVIQSTIWVEEEATFAFYDASEEERGILAEFIQNEQQIKKAVMTASQK